jgi:hypothetical protein
MHIPIAASDLTRGLPSEDICRRLRTTFISAFTFSSSSESSSEPFNVLSRRFPSAKTAAALTWQDQMFNISGSRHKKEYTEYEGIIPQVEAPTISILQFLVHLFADQVTEPQGNLPTASQGINKATAKAKVPFVHDSQVADVSGKHL